MVIDNKGSVKSKVLKTAAKMFLEKGYSKTTLRDLALNAGVNYGSLTFVFKCKENILCDLVQHVLNYQFIIAEKKLKDITNDKILLYAFETTLQLYLAESSEHMREMYNVSYSLYYSTKVIFDNITQKLEYVFKDHLPHYETKDFYEFEIASSGIMRNFMCVPCDKYFTMDRKIKRFLEATFLLFKVDNLKINEAIDFVKQFNFEEITKEVNETLIEYLESKI